MQRTDTQSIRQVLTTLFEKNPTLANLLAETRLISYWTDQMHPMISQYTREVFIEKKVLYVCLYSSALKNELTMCREKLVSHLNKEAGRKIIDQIVFI